MKPVAPEVLRKGVLVRVAGGPDDAGVQVVAHAFLDLRFSDDHVERWLGSGGVREMPAGPGAMPALQAWAREIVCEYASDIMGDVAREYAVASPWVVDRLPCEEIVFEWNSEWPRLRPPSDPRDETARLAKAGPTDLGVSWPDIARKPG